MSKPGRRPGCARARVCYRERWRRKIQPTVCIDLGWRGVPLLGLCSPSLASQFSVRPRLFLSCTELYRYVRTTWLCHVLLCPSSSARPFSYVSDAHSLTLVFILASEFGGKQTLHQIVSRNNSRTRALIGKQLIKRQYALAESSRNPDWQGRQHLAITSNCWLINDNVCRCTRPPFE